MKIKISLLLIFSMLIIILQGGITDVIIAPTPLYPCNEVNIRAKITGENIVKITLYYKMSRSTSVYIAIDMTPCGDDLYCAAVPAKAFSQYGIFWYIVAEDTYGTLIRHGSVESPNELYPSLGINNPKEKSMTLRLIKDSVFLICEPLQDGDVINAYFKDNCNQRQVGGTVTFENNTDDEIEITLYGDSDPNDDYINGFEEGNDIVLKIYRGTKDYSVSLTNDIYYHTNSNLLLEEKISTGKRAGMELTYNDSIIVNHQSYYEPVTEEIDFGTINSDKTYTFTITSTHCHYFYIQQVELDDDENFSIVMMPLQEEINEGESREFYITYHGKESATAQIKIFCNLPSSPFIFYVKGENDNRLPVYSITYELNGGENNPANPNSYTFGNEIILNDATKGRHAFVGWFEDADFQTLVTKINATDEGNKHFYAKFIEQGANDIQEIKDDKIVIYPNPTTGIINIISNDGAIKDISVYTINGVLVKTSGTFLQTNKTTSVNMSELPNGIYLLKIDSDKGSLIRKVIKE